MFKRFRKMFSIVSLTLISTLMFSTLASAGTEKQSASMNANVINIKNVQYDLSNLKDASKYFEVSGQSAELIKNVSLSKIKEDATKFLDKSDKDRAAIPDYNKHLQILIDEGFFKALSIDTSNIKTGIVNNKPSKGVLPAASGDTFDLQSHLNANKQSMYSVYNSDYNLYVANYFPPATAASMAYQGVSLYFACNVRTGGIWDYKVGIGWNTYNWVIVNGSYYWLPGEDVGNIHYGYVGRTFYSSTTLLSAAGLYQISSGTFQMSWFASYFDDPNDQIAIRKGITYFDTGYFSS